MSDYFDKMMIHYGQKSDKMTMDFMYQCTGCECEINLTRIPEAKSCLGCGTPIQSYVKDRINFGMPDAMPCTCGWDNRTDWHYCGGCGDPASRKMKDISEQMFVGNLMSQYAEKAGNIRMDHIEMMAAAYCKATDMPPDQVELVEVHEGAKISWHFQPKAVVDLIEPLQARITAMHAENARLRKELDLVIKSGNGTHQPECTCPSHMLGSGQHAADCPHSKATQ